MLYIYIIMCVCSSVIQYKTPPSYLEYVKPSNCEKRQIVQKYDDKWSEMSYLVYQPLWHNDQRCPELETYWLLLFTFSWFFVTRTHSEMNNFYYQLERYLYFANFNDEQRIFNKQIIQYIKLILVINYIVYLWPWICKIFHENCKQISKFYP